MHVLARYPMLRVLTAIEVEGLAQGVVTDAADRLDGDASGLLRRQLDDFCAARDARLHELEPEIESGLYEPRLTPHPNEEQREAIFAVMETELRALDDAARFAMALELYEFAALEEGPMDPILLAELQLRIEEHERHPSAAIPYEEVMRRLAELKEKWKTKDTNQ
jgi:hypothetical protein